MPIKFRCCFAVIDSGDSSAAFLSCVSVCANLTADLVLIADVEEKQIPVRAEQDYTRQKELIQNVGSTESSDMITGLAGSRM